jgi:hypothetical protein
MLCELDKMIDMRKAFFALSPSRYLVADIRARVIWESPAEHVDYSVKELDTLRLAEPFLHS